MQIDINFRAFKKLTAMRPDESTSYDDVVCDLLKIPREPKGGKSNSPNHAALVRQDVVFPSGTSLKATHKGRSYTARVVDGKIVIDGIDHEPTTSFSRAARFVTGNSVNGWAFWKGKRPTDSEFIPLLNLRKEWKR